MAINIKTYETLLRTRLSELNTRLNRIEDDLDTEPSKDWEDAAVERADDEVLEDLGLAGLQEIDAIRAALHRVADGTYGICVHCGEEILSARLDIVPQAALCRNCARAA